MRRSERRYFRLAYGAWLFGIFAFFIPGASWNPVSRFSLTRALVERREVNIDAFVTNTGDRARVGEHWYSDKAPIASLIAVPAYAAVHVAQQLRNQTPRLDAVGSKTAHARIVPNRAYQQGLYVASLSTSGLAGVAVGLLLFEFLRRRTTSIVAFLASSLLVLASPILPYATNLYGHTLAGAFLLGALVCLDQRGQLGRSGLLAPGRLRAAGACLVLAAGSEYITALPGIVVAVWFLLGCQPHRRLPALTQLFLGALLPALLIASYHTAAFGRPWNTGYSFITRAEFASGHATGLLGIGWPSVSSLVGLTFGQGGLFYVWPILLFAVMFSVRHALRRKDWAASAGLAALGSLLLVNAGYYMWWGGSALGPRHLIPGLPVLAIGLALALRSGRSWLTHVTLVFGALSIAATVIATAVALEPPEHRDLRDYVFRRFANAKLWNFSGATNLGARLGLTDRASLLPLVLWCALGYWYLLVQLGRARADRRLSSTDAA